MRNKILIAVAIMLPLCTWAQKNPLKTQSDSLSYAVGINLAHSLKQGGIKELEKDAFYLAITHVLEENKQLMDIQTAGKIVNEYIASKQQGASASVNLMESEKWLGKNRTQKGVVTLASGLQYKVLAAGSGPSPTTSNKVTVHYTGKLVDGTVFDSSVQRGTPATFGVTQVIKGWTEALQLMKVGSKWMLYIHPDLAYGTSARAPGGPNKLLIFEVELLGIK